MTAAGSSSPSARSAARRVELDPARQRRRKPTEDEVRVGDGGQLSATPVAGGAWIRSSALRSDAQRAALVQPHDRASARAYGVHGERRKADGKTANEPLVLPLGDAVHDRAHVRRRPAHVERERVRVSGEGGDARRADDSGGRPGEKSECGMGRGLLERCDSARGAHHLRGRELRLGARSRKGSQVAGQDRPQVRVDRRRRCALVLAELGRDLVRGDDVQRRIAATDLVRDGLLGSGIAKGEQQAHRHRLRVQLGKRRQVERDELALTARPLADSVAALERDERRWVLGARPIEVRPRLAAEVQEVLEALVRHERRARAASLQECVRWRSSCRA